MASAGRLTGHERQGGVEDPEGVLDAVVRAAGSPSPVPITARGFLLATTLESAREVLTRPADYTLPFDVSRGSIRSLTDGDRVKDTPPLRADAVARGRAVFVDELRHLRPVGEVETLDLLRGPVALSTTAALLPDAADDVRRAVAAGVLRWVDTLAPVIAARRPPRPWRRTRREEKRARRDLIRLLADSGASAPAELATALAAGVQVPIAAGAWCLVLLADDPALQRRLATEPSLALPFVWEVLRLYPPTWLVARITTREVDLAGTTVPAYSPVVVSPVALGRIPALVGHGAPLDRLDPDRWTGDARPGAWLPFGAGPHACPGRNLGLAQLTALVTWAGGTEWTATGPLGIDTSRGLAPLRSRVVACERIPDA